MPDSEAPDPVCDTRLVTKNTLIVESNWEGDCPVECQFTSVVDRDEVSFMVMVGPARSDGLKFTICELRAIITFAESEFLRLGGEHQQKDTR